VDTLRASDNARFDPNVRNPTSETHVSIQRAESQQIWRKSARKWGEGDGEYGTFAVAFVNQLALMLFHDAVRHEEAEPGAAFFGGEMWFEQVMAIVI
jgi:hypothetical protein